MDALIINMQITHDESKGTSAACDDDALRTKPELVTAQRIIDTCSIYIENGKGKPFNYRPTRKERQEMNIQAKQKAESKNESVPLGAKEFRQTEMQAQEQQQLEEKEIKNSYIREEMKMLERRAMPLRQYLLESIVPILTEGLLDVCKTKPNDPVDYLAEWLFRNNPEANLKDVPPPKQKARQKDAQ
jgi:adenylate kinase